jgi:hypothetical protein
MYTNNKLLIARVRATAQTHYLLPNIYLAVIQPLRNISTIFVQQVGALPHSFPHLSPQWHRSFIPTRCARRARPP